MVHSCLLRPRDAILQTLGIEVARRKRRDVGVHAVLSLQHGARHGGALQALEEALRELGARRLARQHRGRQLLGVAHQHNAALHTTPGSAAATQMETSQACAAMHHSRCTNCATMACNCTPECWAHQRSRLHCRACGDGRSSALPECARPERGAHPVWVQRREGDQRRGLHRLRRLVHHHRVKHNVRRAQHAPTAAAAGAQIAQRREVAAGRGQGAEDELGAAKGAAARLAGGAGNRVARGRLAGLLQLRLQELALGGERCRRGGACMAYNTKRGSDDETQLAVMQLGPDEASNSIGRCWAQNLM